ARHPRVAPDQVALPAEHPRRGAAQGEHQLGGELGVGDTADTVGAEPEGHGGLYRLEYCGALRAFFRPYFFDSLTRASRVSSPAFLSWTRRSGSRSTRPRAIPSRRAPAWPEMPPPSMVASMS